MPVVPSRESEGIVEKIERPEGAPLAVVKDARAQKLHDLCVIAAGMPWSAGPADAARRAAAIYNALKEYI